MAMNSFQAYTYGTAAWLSLQAITLLLSPRLIITLLGSSARDVTEIETYFARTTALAQLALAALTLLHSDFLTQDPDLNPTGTTSQAKSDSDANNTSKTPTATATLILTTVYHLTTCIHTYVTYTSASTSQWHGQQGSAGMYLLGSVGAGALATTGLFVLMFGDEKARGSRWPFESAEERTRRKERRKRRLGKGL